MKKQYITLIFTLSIFLWIITAFAINPKDLVRVSVDNKVKCVEYYIYQGESYCSTTAQEKTPVDPNIIRLEKFKISFDDRPWKIAWGKNTSEVVTIEYIPNDQNIDSWVELVTSQYFPRSDISPKAYAVSFLDQLTSLGFFPQVTFYEQTEQEVIFEFKIAYPPAQIQNEIQIVKKMPNGLYVLHYVIKVLDMGTNKRNIWLNNFHHLKKLPEDVKK